MPPKLPQPQVKAVLTLMQTARQGIAQAKDRFEGVSAVTDAEMAQMDEEAALLRAEVTALNKKISSLSRGRAVYAEAEETDPWEAWPDSDGDYGGTTVVTGLRTLPIFRGEYKTGDSASP